MRIVILATMMLSMGAGVALGEFAAAGRPAAVATAEQASKPSAHAAAIADCERMWDRATHMTKVEWSRTCRRVQNRLLQLEVR